MNYLAHLYFSDPSPLAWAGSLMGDFVKGSDLSGLPGDLVRHLKLHRHIDSFTLRSDSFQKSRKRLDPRFRYARGVLVDVFYDHILACQWGSYSQQPLPEFSSDVYRGLQSCYELLSPGLQKQLPHMVEYDWLTSYREPQVVQRVLQRLEERIQHKFPLASGFPELERWQGELENDFSTFMPEAGSVVAKWKLTH
ncbi:MAG: acyl carrier protein phosphodiesterase [Deltaproteobacteria bacterium]|nr:acyl carrier protein phosphodiesterase [Deltaproteobacteria bacterium]MCW8892720.1 acyl carrier protein phosphodiesterase [Deltaproteobacteria bacterium]MCW9049088.1 acyl carrier protein phosphodiesterase [Deltaproteobacteria bacterium]